MNILRIEQLFQVEDTLDQALLECQEQFQKVDTYASEMQMNLTSNPDQAKTALNELTGVFMKLKTVLAIAESEKRNREIRKYNEIKIEIENSGGKFVSASAEKEASASVGSYRRVRNIIQGYADACEKAISTLQSVLRYLGEEMKLAGKEE